MKLSIIVPAYNVEHYISECLDSLLNQDLSVNDYEIIVVNDGSTDGTLKIIDSYIHRHSNIKVFSQKNSGLSVARNSGVDRATGNFILFVDADDTLVHKSLKILGDYIDKQNLDFLGFGIKDSTDRKSDISFSSPINILVQGSGNQIIESFNYRNSACWYIFNKRKARGLHFIPGIYFEDAPFTPRLILLMDKCVVIANTVYLYSRDNPDSITKSEPFVKKIKLIEDMLLGVESFHDLYTKYPLSKTAHNNLKRRQESFVYYAIIRFLRLHVDFSLIEDTLKKFRCKEFDAYPVKNFRGYNKHDPFLIFMINHKLLFRILNYFNSKLKVLK